MDKKKIKELIEEVQTRLIDAEVEIEPINISENGEVKVDLKGPGLDKKKGKCPASRRSSPKRGRAKVSKETVILILEDRLKGDIAEVTKVGAV